MSRRVGIVAFVVASTAVYACANVLSLEDAEVDPTFQPGSGGSGSGGSGAGGPDVAPTLCETYCDTVMTSCTGAFAVYASREGCLAVCALLPEGIERDDQGNTVRCRLRNAEEAGPEPSFYCPIAGPGGNGTCGSNCDGLCTIAQQVCVGDDAVWPSMAKCEDECGRLNDLMSFSTDSSSEMYEGAHVECRLFHACAAAVQDPDIHCKHVGGASPCVEQTDGT